MSFLQWLGSSKIKSMESTELPTLSYRKYKLEDDRTFVVINDRLLLYNTDDHDTLIVPFIEESDIYEIVNSYQDIN